MDNDYYAVIMAGGGGTRLWPVSRQATPKQVTHLLGDDSLFQIAVHRLDGLFPAERILVVTTEKLFAILHAQCPQIPVENFLLEPQPKGTASVVGLAAAVLQRISPQAVMAILTADHFIENIPQFRRLLRAAYLAARQGMLVTLGIAPTFPATGYGYIQSGAEIGEYEGLPIQQALRFKEKPALQQAHEFYASGNHTWNSGMFIWQVKDIQAEFARQMPEIYQHMRSLSQDWNTDRWQAALKETWDALRPTSIDYGIMEGAEHVAVIPAPGLGWYDVGSWDALFNVLPQDDDGNIINAARGLAVESHNTLLYSNQPSRLVVTIGVNDLVVVDTGDVVLVCHKDQAQKVRQAVEQIKARYPDLQ
ncbi:MAG: sugar phosphate nucleotidyltransferase [Anaerolineales bacterium]|jgi:mannose-1-phosphate guanylyltransferase|nr:sugar phosphate nucleotidyltransferase [Anaerolineales bacterium]